MSVLVQNTGSLVEHIDVYHVARPNERDTITVQAGGRVTLPRGFRVAPMGVKLPHLKVTGNDAPVSPLELKE